MTNVNIGQFLLDICNFFANVCEKVYDILFYPINLTIPFMDIDWHWTVFQLIGVASVGIFVTVLIIRIIRG